MVNHTLGIKGILTTFIKHIMRKGFLFVLVFFCLSGCAGKSVCIGEANIAEKELSKQDAEQLERLFQRLEMYKYSDSSKIWAGAGDIFFYIKKGNTETVIQGLAINGMITLPDGCYFTDPYDDFYDYNRQLRKQYGYSNILLNIQDNQILQFDMNTLACDVVPDWKDREELVFKTYAVGKNVSIMDFYAYVGKETTDERLFQEFVTEEGVEMRMESIRFKKLTGTNIMTQEEDCLYLVKLND